MIVNLRNLELIDLLTMKTAINLELHRRLHGVPATDNYSENVLKMPVSKIRMPTKTFQKRLESSEFQTIEDVIKTGKMKMLKMRGYGKKFVTSLFNAIDLIQNDILNDATASQTNIPEEVR